MLTACDELAEQLGLLVDPVGLIAQHVNDGTGHCALCAGASQAGRTTWPCRIHSLAGMAIQRAQR